MPGTSTPYCRKGWPAITRRAEEGDRLDLSLPERRRSSTVWLSAVMHECNFGAELSSAGVRWMPCSNHTLWHQGGEATHGLQQGVFFSWRFLKTQLGSSIQICDPGICCPYHRMERCKDSSSMLEGDQWGRSRSKQRVQEFSSPPRDTCLAFWLWQRGERTQRLETTWKPDWTSLLL